MADAASSFTVASTAAGSAGAGRVTHSEIRNPARSADRPGFEEGATFGTGAPGVPGVLASARSLARTRAPTAGTISPESGGGRAAAAAGGSSPAAGIVVASGVPVQGVREIPARGALQDSTLKDLIFSSQESSGRASVRHSAPPPAPDLSGLAIRSPNSAVIPTLAPSGSTTTVLASVSTNRDGSGSSVTVFGDGGRTQTYNFAAAAEASGSGSRSRQNRIDIAA